MKTTLKGSTFGKFQKNSLNKSEKALISGGQTTSTAGDHAGQTDTTSYTFKKTNDQVTQASDVKYSWSGGGETTYTL